MEQNQGTDLSPHGAVIVINWSIHRQLAGGNFTGGTSGNGQEVFVLRGQDRALTIAKLKALLESISKEASENGKTQFEAKRFDEACVQGNRQPSGNPVGMLGMRGTPG